MSTGRSKGRPTGAKTVDRDLVDTVATRCRVCNSTERTDYHQVTRIEGSGQAPDGKPYSAVSLRPTQCLNCGQYRTDREYEYVPVENG